MEYAGSGRSEALSREQFDEFYFRTARRLQGYIRRLTADPAVVEDILQESYVRLLSAPPLQETQRKSYLYRTATNLVVDHRRAQSRHRRWWQMAPRRSEAEAADPELSSDMERLFARLEAPDRALLWLAYVEGAAHREIAEILQLREKSVKVLLYRARRKMEAILQEAGYERR